MALRKMSRNTFAAAALGGVIASSASSPALADNNAEQLAAANTYIDAPLDASIQSIRFAKEQNGIGMVIAYGAYEGAPDPDYVGERFKQKFAELGERSEYYIVNTETPGYSISFDHRFDGTDPMSLSDAARLLKEFVAEKRRFEGYLTVNLDND